MNNFNIDLKNISLIDFAKKEVDILKIDGVPVWYKYEDPNTPGRFLAYKLNQSATVNGEIKQVIAINPPIVTFQGPDDIDPIDINIKNPGTDIISPLTGIDADLDGVDSGVDIDDNDPTVGSQVYVEILGDGSDATFYQNNQEGLRFNHPVGSLVTVRVVAVAGKRFTEWNATGAQLLSSELVQQEITFTMPKTNVILTPTFATSADFQYSLTIDQDVGGTVSGGGAYKALQEVEITATPRIGYNFVRWESSDVVVYTPNETTTKLLMPDSNVVVTPVFEAQEFQITLNDTAGGSLDVSSHAVSSGSIIVKFEENVEISAVADSSGGYSFVRWHISGFTFNGDINNPNLSFAMPAANVTISAEFESAEFDVVIAPTSTGTSSGAGVYAPGTLVTIAASPPSTNSWAYEFAGWSASGVTLDNANAETTTFVMPGNNVNISFSYTTIRATVNVALPTDGGVTINGQTVTSLEVDAGSTVTLSASVPASYSFLEWNVASNNASLVDVNSASTSFVMPAEDVNLTYLLDFANFTLDVSSNILSGNTFDVSINGVAASTNDFPSSLSIKAQSLVSIDININDSDTEVSEIIPTGIDSPTIQGNSIQFLMPSSNCSISVEFLQTQFELSIKMENPFSGDTLNTSIAEQDMLVEISQDEAFTNPQKLEYLSSTSNATDAPITDPSDLALTGNIWFVMTTIPKDHWVRITSIPPNGSSHGDWTSNKNFTASGSTTNSLEFTDSTNLSTPFKMPSDNVRLTTNFISQPIFRVVVKGGYDWGLGVPTSMRTGVSATNDGHYDGEDATLMGMTVTPQSGSGLKYKYHRFETVSIAASTWVSDQDFMDRSDIAFGMQAGTFAFAQFYEDLIGIDRIDNGEYVTNGLDVLLNPNIQGNTLTFQIPNVADPTDHNIIVFVEYSLSVTQNTLHLSIPGWSAPGSGDAGDRITVVDHTGTELTPTQGGNTAGTSYTEGTQVTLTASGGNLKVFENWVFAKWNTSDDDTFVPTSSTHDLESTSITFTLGQDLSAEVVTTDKLQVVLDYSEYTQGALTDGEKAIIRDACDYIENVFKPIPGEIETYTLKITDFNDSAPGGTLASAGIRSFHSPSIGVWLPDVGFAKFDPLDTPAAAAAPFGDKTELWYTTVHELIHAFGLSSGQWNNNTLGSKYDLVELSEEWGAQYKGTQGVAAYNEFWGTSLTRLPIQTKQVNATLLNGQATAPLSSINNRYVLSWHIKNVTSNDISTGTCKHADVFNAYTSESSSSVLAGLFNVPATWEVEVVSANTTDGYTVIGDVNGSNPAFKIFSGSSIVFKSPFHGSHPLEFYDEQSNQITVPYNSSNQTYTFTPSATDNVYTYRCGIHSSMSGSIEVVSSWSNGDSVKYAVANTWAAHIAEHERRRSNATTTTTNTLYETRKFENNQQPLMDEILMTPYIDDNFTTKMSSITAGIMKDLGWEIRDKFVDEIRPVEWIMEEASSDASPTFTKLDESSNYSASNTAHTKGLRLTVNNIPDWLANLSDSNIRIISHRKSISFPADASWNVSGTTGIFKMSGGSWSFNGANLLEVNSSSKSLTFIPLNLSSGRSVSGNIVYDTIGLDESRITIYNAADTSQFISSPFYWTVPGTGVTTDGLFWNDDAQIVNYNENSTGEIVYDKNYTKFGDSSMTVNFSMGGDDRNLFNINSSSGSITFKSPPDFENPQDANGDNTYEISVRAYSTSNPEVQTDDKLISITIVDQNEVSLSWDNPDAQIVNHLENSTDAVFYNKDYTKLGDNSMTVNFSISGDDSNLFNIDSSTGSITFKSPPDFENPQDANGDNTYEISVKAYSVSDPQIETDEKLISISIINLNDSSFTVSITVEGGRLQGVTAQYDVDNPTTITQTYTAGDTVTLVSEPYSMYRHVAWSSSSAGVTIVDPSNTTLSFMMPSNNVEISLTSEQYIFELTLDTIWSTVTGFNSPLTTYGDASNGTRIGGAQYAEGTVITLTSVPDNGYTHKAWSSSSGLPIVNPSHTTISFAMPMANVDLTLECEEDTPTPDGTTRKIYLSLPGYATYSSTADKIYVQDQNGNELIPTQGGNYTGNSYDYGTSVTLTAYADSTLKLFTNWSFAKWNTGDNENYVPTNSSHNLTASSVTFLVGQDLSCQATFIDNPDHQQELILSESEFDAMSTSELSQLTVVDASPVAGENEPSVGSVLAIYEIITDYSNMSNPFSQGPIIDYGLVTEVIDDQYYVSYNQAAYTGKKPGQSAGSYLYWSHKFRVKYKSTGSESVNNHNDFAQGFNWDILS